MLDGKKGVKMTKDDVIRMAREAGLAPICSACDEPDVSYAYEDWDEELEKFAALVAAAEREAILDTVNELMGSERERHPMFSEGHSYALESLQTFILARSNS